MTPDPTQTYKRLPKRLPLSKGFSRYSLKFDGSDDYTETGANIGITGAQNRSVSFWMKTTVSAGFVYRPWDWGAHAANEAFIFQLDDANTFRIANWAGKSRWDYDYNDGEWHHFVIILDGNNLQDLKCYADGELLTPSLQDNAAINTTDSHFFTGADITALQNFPGSLDEIAIYNVALTGSEVRNLFLNYHRPPRKNDLVGWWRMEKGHGTTVKDKVAGNDATMKNFADPYGWKKTKKWELRAEAGL